VPEESFDDFAKARDQRQSDAENLAKSTAAEWVILKGFVSQFALDGKDIDGHKFQWFPEPNAERLVLNYSSAMLLTSGWSIGVPHNFRVRVDRRPPGPGQVYVLDEPPVPPKTWSLEPKVERGEFFWVVPEQGWKKSSAALASEIAKAVVEHYDEYKRKYPQAV
jgi:hypothetical protein